jgi:hypothetical protein
MDYKSAKVLSELLAERYLFSKQLQYAGFDDEDDLADERVSETFQSVIGIGIGRRSSDESFFFRFYHTKPIPSSDAYLIAEECKITVDDVEFEQIEPFVTQDGKGFFDWLRGRPKLQDRPVKIGSSIGRLRSPEYGSVGCFVRGHNGIYLLSNHHVLFDVKGLYADHYIVQPGGEPGGGIENVIGQYHRSLPFGEEEINEFDAALAGPLSCEVSHQIINSEEGDKDRNLNGTEEPDYDMEVYKIGTASKLTIGVVTDLSVSALIKFGDTLVSFKNLMLIKGYNQEKFSKHGDSGSLVISNATDRAIGLLFAGSSSGMSLACPIEPILLQFGVDLFL